MGGHPGALLRPSRQGPVVQVDPATGGWVLGPLPRSWPLAQPPSQLCLWLLPTDCLHPVFPCVYKSGRAREGLMSAAHVSCWSPPPPILAPSRAAPNSIQIPGPWEPRPPS